MTSAGSSFDDSEDSPQHLKPSDIKITTIKTLSRLNQSAQPLSYSRNSKVTLEDMAPRQKPGE